MRLRQPPRRGAALLLAMLILTLVATLAGGMFWQQSRALQVEAAERARAQSLWILSGAMDWARLILREDMRSSRSQGQPPIDSLDEPWATPLAEARLSSFLAADRDNNADSGPEAFLAGAIVDAQARYNLQNLLSAGKVVPAQLAALQRLCISVGLGPDTADMIASGLAAASRTDGEDAPLAPQTLADLRWLGLDAWSIERLSGVVVLLPLATPINLNTASREVLAAVVPGLDLGSADRLVQARARQPLRSLAEAAVLLGKSVTLNEREVDVKSSFFEVRGRMRLEQRVIEVTSLVQRRNGLQVVAIQRQQQSSFVAAPR